MAAATRIAVVGAGDRGRAHARIIAKVPEWGTITAVAEPRREYREAFAAQYGLPSSAAFSDWRELAKHRGLYDTVVVCTQDRDHVDPAVTFLDQGCHLLLEKPMATSLEDCRRILEADARAGTVTAVCHSLRYHVGFSALAGLVRSGRIGRVVTIDQLEQVAWSHQAHSFVRGNWGNEGRSTFMLMAKSCHDIDYIASLVDAGCRRVSSFGSLSYFTRQNAPAGSAERCVDCRLKDSCAYSALRHYVDVPDREDWPAEVVSHDHSREAHLQAITDGPYGRCAWKCDNDVVDHQVVNLEFDNQVTATFTMTAFTQSGGRLIRVNGTEGDVQFAEKEMTVRTFADAKVERIVFPKEEGGHGGGDERVMVGFLGAIREKRPAAVVTNIRESFRTHAIVFAAELSRRQGRVVEMEETGA